MAHPGGRPPKYTNPEDMQKIIDEYFKSCEGKPLTIEDPETGEQKPYFDKYGQPVMIGVKPPTVTGLCLALGFTSREALINYQEKDEYFDTILRAKLKCHEYAESRLYDKDGANGAKFSLANNFGWIDRTEVIQHNDILIESAEDRRARIADLLKKSALLEGIKVPYSVEPEEE